MFHLPFKRGNINTNDRGESLLLYIVAFNLYIFNKGNTTTFVTKARSELLDLILWTNSIHNVFNKWYGSDKQSMLDRDTLSLNSG